jgi:biopolymer transport protein ExbB
MKKYDLSSKNVHGGRDVHSPGFAVNNPQYGGPTSRRPPVGARGFFLLVVAFVLCAGIAQASPAPTDGATILRSHIEELYAVPMMPLWACSFVLLMLIFERALALRASRTLDRKLAEDVIGHVSSLDLDAAHKACEQSGTLVGRAWAQGLHEFILGGVALEETLTNASLLALKPLKRNVQGISTISAIAPLLGLLGTVIGMVLVFDEIRISLNPDKQKMAEGIMIALFTTIFGIAIAVPGLIAGRYFTSRIQRFAEIIEADIDRVRYSYLHARAKKGEGT